MTCDTSRKKLRKITWINTFSAGLYPKITRKSLKKSKIPNFAATFGLRIERRTRCTHLFCPKTTGNVLISTFQLILSFSGPKTSQIVLKGLIITDQNFFLFLFLSDKGFQVIIFSKKKCIKNFHISPVFCLVSCLWFKNYFLGLLAIQATFKVSGFKNIKLLKTKNWTNSWPHPLHICSLIIWHVIFVIVSKSSSNIFLLL